jgi:serine/threonine-protein kinase
VTAQLIDARTGRASLADRYDRDLPDVFAIQSEIAQQIAQQLQAALSPKEKAAMETKTDGGSGRLRSYLRAKEFDQNFFTSETPERLEQLTRLLDEAVGARSRLRPGALLVGAGASRRVWFNVDPLRTSRAARKALEAAARIRPDDGELRMSLAYQHYWGARDYEPALAEAALARRALPNDAGVLILLGAIERRQGRWAESTQHLTEAMALDPRNVRILSVLRTNYFWLRQYDDGVRVLAGILTWKPHDFPVANAIADAAYFGKADLRQKEQVVSGEAAKTATPEALTVARVELALLQRNPAPRVMLSLLSRERSLTWSVVTSRHASGSKA